MDLLDHMKWQGHKADFDRITGGGIVLHTRPLLVGSWSTCNKILHWRDICPFTNYGLIEKSSIRTQIPYDGASGRIQIEIPTTSIQWICQRPNLALAGLARSPSGRLQEYQARGSSTFRLYHHMLS